MMPTPVKCRVELIGTDEPGGVVRVTDDGLGMSRQAILDGWLVLGSSRKQTRVTERKRRVIGNKGLGRLAALRLGKTTNVTTWPKGEAFQYSLAIDWADFAAVKVVEGVSLRIEQASKGKDAPEHGTVVEIQKLHAKLTRAEVKRLARALVLMSDPFDKSLGFQPTLVAPGQKDLESLVASSYFEEAQFHLVAELLEDRNRWQRKCSTVEGSDAVWRRTGAMIFGVSGKSGWHRAPLQQSSREIRFMGVSTRRED